MRVGERGIVFTVLTYILLMYRTSLSVVLNTLVSNPDTRYKSMHPSYLLLVLGIMKHLLMIAHKQIKVLITMRKDQQTLLSL